MSEVRRSFADFVARLLGAVLLLAVSSALVLSGAVSSLVGGDTPVETAAPAAGSGVGAVVSPATTAAPAPTTTAAPAPTTTAAPAPTTTAAPAPSPTVVASRQPQPTPTTAPKATTTTTTAPRPSGPSGTGTWALIVGVNNYPGSAYDLNYAVNDALDLNNALANFGVPSRQRRLLTNGQATGAAIRAGLRWLVANAGPKATAIVFYSGHGTSRGSTQEIVGADFGYVSDAAMASDLRGLRAGKTWIALVSCYSGGFAEVRGPGRILTAAAPAGSLAYENSGYQRSYMVQWMIREAWLQGKAGHSVEAAFAYASQRAQQINPNRAPVQWDQVSGELRF